MQRGPKLLARFSEACQIECGFRAALCAISCLKGNSSKDHIQFTVTVTAAAAMIRTTGSCGCDDIGTRRGAWIAGNQSGNETPGRANLVSSLFGLFTLPNLILVGENLKALIMGVKKFQEWSEVVGTGQLRKFKGMRISSRTRAIKHKTGGTPLHLLSC
jgi:hypothetical protein